MSNIIEFFDLDVWIGFIYVGVIDIIFLCSCQMDLASIDLVVVDVQCHGDVCTVCWLNVNGT